MTAAEAQLHDLILEAKAQGISPDEIVRITVEALTADATPFKHGEVAEDSQWHKELERLMWQCQYHSRTISGVLHDALEACPVTQQRRRETRQVLRRLARERGYDYAWQDDTDPAPVAQ